VNFPFLPLFRLIPFSFLFFRAIFSGRPFASKREITTGYGIKHCSVLVRLREQSDRNGPRIVEPQLDWRNSTGATRLVQIGQLKIKK